MGEPEWFVQAFSADYLRVYPHRSAEEARAQVGQLLRTGLLPRRGRVLDLCCGAGRHLHAMRGAGLNAVGLDLSIDLLKSGAVDGLAVRADARRIPFADARFDAVVNLFTSFGYFADEADNLRMLLEARRVLKPGGRFVIDHMNAQVAVAALVPESREQGLVQRRLYSAAARRITKEVEFDGRRWIESVRVFTPAELDALLAGAGLRVTARYAGFDGTHFVENSSPRQLVVAVRDSA